MTQDPRHKVSKENERYMLSIFRAAIPEISQNADVVFVHSNPWHIPRDLGNMSIELPQFIYLETYKVPGPGKSVFEFTIARYLPDCIPPRELVLVLQIPPEKLPEELKAGEFYIMQYIENKPIPRSDEVRAAPWDDLDIWKGLES